MREEYAMADLKTEYTNRGGRTCAVEHLVVPDSGNDGRERLLEELAGILTRPDEPVSA